jgi:uncharacterized membrane protein
MSDKGQVQASSSQSLMYSGPLPTSGEFKGYEQALPGAADRILAIAEKESEHRHDIERKELKIKNRGQIFALVISVLSLLGIGLSIFFNQPIASIAPAIIAITGLASIFTSKNR